MVSKLKSIKPQGFTLIELLIVLAIIGILATVIIVSLSQARAQARDARRLSDMHEIKTALALYYDKIGKYPGDTDSYGECETTGTSNSPCVITGGGCWDTSSENCNPLVDNQYFITPLVTEGFFTSVPVDPINTTNGFWGYKYRYYRYSAGAGGCDSSKGKFYVLGIVDLETVEGTPGPVTNHYPDSPGWKCTTDWGNYFEWVTGSFEG